MLDWLESWLQQDDTALLYILIVIMVMSMLDLLMGWVNAKFNKEIEFVSSVALLGIIKKIVYFTLLVAFIPVALLLPDTVGISALHVMYIGYLFSEINSVLSHLKLTDDGKRTEVFADFVKKMMGGKTNE